MRKQILLIFLTSFIHIPSYADVIQTFDDTKNCTRYIISRTDVETQRLQDQGGQIVHKKMVYGFSLENLRIDFDKREVRVDIIQKIAFSLNKPLIRSAKVSKSLESIKKYSNILNHDFDLLQSICIDEQNEIVDSSTISNDSHK